MVSFQSYTFRWMPPVNNQNARTSVTWEPDRRPDQVEWSWRLRQCLANIASEFVLTFKLQHVRAFFLLLLACLSLFLTSPLHLALSKFEESMHQSTFSGWKWYLIIFEHPVGMDFKYALTLSAVILEPRNIKSVTVSTVSPSISHEVMGPDAMIFIF